MKLFVYGTLMRGNSNYEEYLLGGRFIGKAVLKDYALYDLGDYPGIVPRRGSNVKGEVFDIDEAAKARIDELEEEGSLYTASEVNVILDGGETTDALTYVYNLSIDGMEYVPEESQPLRYKKR
jgi:gamma-glutamylaminecyclotransferase